MNGEHAAFEQWDAAYVLGALTPADRRAFEEHLESCERCVRAVAELAPTLGLLARVDPLRAASLQDAEPAADAGAAPHVAEWPPARADGRDELLARAAREARRRRGWWTGGLAAAAVLLIAVAIAVGALLAPAADREVELAAVVDAPLTASVGLSSVAWGTRIDLECSYGGDGGGGEGLPYTLVVLDREGRASEVSTWRAAPGETARLSAATALDVGEIGAIEILMTDSGEVLMRADLRTG